MNVFVVLIFLDGLTGISAGPNTEFVTLHDLNSDHHRRNLFGGLPSYLDFTLQRADGNVYLRLVENTRLSRNPPVYVSKKTAEGRIKWVEKKVPLIETERFYQDFNNLGAFSVQCEVDFSGPCRRVLTGNMFIDGRNFDIVPATGAEYKRGLTFGTGTPHLLIENDSIRDIAHGKINRRHSGSVQRNVSLNRDYMVPKNVRTTHRSIKQEEQGLYNTLKKLLENQNTRRSKRSAKTKYTIEIGMVMDPITYARTYNRTTATGDRTREEETNFQLKRRACQLINMVSLLYRSINEPDVEFDVTLTNILIKPERDETWNLPENYKIGNNGQYYTDGRAYHSEVSSWLGKQTNLPTNIDHITVLTSMNIYVIGNKTQHDDLVGIAWLGFICHSTGKTSVIEDSGGYFMTSSTLAHELGHNLGADHDGEESAKECRAEDENIMTAYGNVIDENRGYSVNPYRFSSCSITAFKRTIAKLGNNCLLNNGSIYNLTEWTTNTEKLPGELNDHAAQCKLMYGSNSKPCDAYFGWNSKYVCEVMQCTSESGACTNKDKAATGTACGEYKWCLEGICASKNSQPAIPGQCVDRKIGYLDCASAKEKGKYTKLDDFCKYHSSICCKYCSNKGVTYILVGNEKTGDAAGRLEVLYNGEWGTVCGNNFGLNEANVACRSLGFSHGNVAVGSEFQQGATWQRIWMDNVKCNGKETALGFCTFPEWGSHSSDCDHSKDVMLKCIPKETDVCEDMGYEDENSHKHYSCTQLAFMMGMYSTTKTGLQICNENKSFPTHCCKFCKDQGYEAPPPTQPVPPTPPPTIPPPPPLPSPTSPSRLEDTITTWNQGPIQ